MTTLDEFAAAHGGNAPIAVFVDATGGFAIDTECVNGPRGNAADHLTADVIPAVNALSGSHRQLQWGVVGFSSGATCAVDLAVMHPNIFSAFVDIGGDLAPNAGDRAQTIDRLFGGDAEKWSSFDPTTVISRHGKYPDLSGVFAVPGTVGRTAAESLCNLGQRHGIDCRLCRCPATMTGPPPHRPSPPRCRGWPVAYIHRVSLRLPSCRRTRNLSTVRCVRSGHDVHDLSCCG